MYRVIGQSMSPGGGGSGGSVGVKEEWQPQPDWWDIDSILKNDTEDYPAKIICLLRDNANTDVIKRLGAAKVKTSDGATYDNTGNEYSHTWNKNYDKSCFLGYKTRYIIWYFSTEELSFPYKSFPNSALYIVTQKMKFKTTIASGVGTFRDCSYLEKIKLKDSELRIGAHFLYGVTRLREIPPITIYEQSIANAFSGVSSTYSDFLDLSNCVKDDLNIVDLNNAFTSSSFKRIDLFDTSHVANFNATFQKSQICTINKLDFSSATNVSNMFSSASNLRNIEQISNIKISGLNFDSCTLLNHATLLRILNALADYSEDTEGTHILTLGATNLAKLTEEEIEIATAKGWTVA